MMGTNQKDVDLPQPDLQAMQARMATDQRELLKLATQRPKGRGTNPDEAAAAKLLLYFSQEMIVDSDVLEAMLDGMRDVAAYVANEALLSQGGQPINVRPLMFFQNDYKTTKKNKKNERVTLAAAFNDPFVAGASRGAPLMSAEEAEYALTRKWTFNDVKDQTFGKEKYREDWPDKRERKDWPKTVRAVEIALLEYVQTKHGASSKEACRNYVHSSFPAIAWGNESDKAVAYPESWNS